MLSTSSETNLNEAQTRFHIIDDIIFSCLGWPKDQVEVENSEQRKFTDYELGKPRLAIIEAKREGSIFSIPAGLSCKLLMDLKSLSRMDSDLSDAIIQVQNYCSQRGVPVGIVTNGSQIIAFLASRQDGISVIDGNAVVFTSLEHLKENFTLAWDLISFHGIKERRIFSYLTNGHSAIPNKLSSKLINYPTVRYKSDTQANLRQLSELFLQDIFESTEIEERFFNECYCESGALSKYALLSKNVLDARYAALFSNSELAPHLTPVKEKKNDNFSPDILAEAISKRPIVLLGDVGVGKTSFVKNLMYRSAYQEFRNAIYIYIDLGSKAALTDDLKAFILDEIENQLYNKYEKDTYDHNFIKGVYASEIYRFTQGIWGKKQETDPIFYETKLFEMLEKEIEKKDKHLNRSLTYFSKTTKKQIIISLDNADQRDYDTQQRTFVISQELAKEWSATVFISVRPQTFFSSKRSGALSAYPHKIFTISPPRIENVIEKRLQFALSMAEGKIPLERLDNIRVNAKNLALFLKALISSLKSNPELNEFITNITGGNIRAAIELVTGFIGSPNIEAEKITNIMSLNGKYVIPLHEFTKSALLGDYSHYNPDTSIALNIFDVTSATKDEHFLIPILLSYLDSNCIQKKNDGFIPTENIFEESQNMGFSETQINSALRRATNKKLIETTQRVTFEEDINGILTGSMPDAFRITSIGAYHLKKWIGAFTYIDAMVFDTPIFTMETKEALSKNINSLSIEDRYSRATIFRQYLKECWLQIPNKPSYFDFQEITKEGQRTFDSVLHAINKKASK
ncbi:hypothetical protein WH50_25220 [Pokkaliibacter plantistimulans]|uniref:KAP NTPase domain-containing protein n=1 Tax=Pokkaliibacter plantistimulans TaxID=1635171 RepID=A0ABX5LSZ1_9GAMM|nr:hypothetical protein WH50_25220 [Pokkaliibacter plantistimulans]